MRHTLVAAFENTLDANRARADLMARGIPRTHIHAVGADSADIHGYGTPYSTSDDTLDRDQHESKVTHFFKSLFGNDESHQHHARAYPEAVRRGALVVAVDVDDDKELVMARDALEYNGAVSIDDPDAGQADLRPTQASEHTRANASHGHTATSPYIGATAGDSHLDKHFHKTRMGTSGAAASGERYSESERPGAGAPVGSAAGSGRTSESGATGYGGGGSSLETDRYEVGSAGKRAGTDYPPTTATTAPTGAGTTGHGSSVGTGDTGRMAASDVGGDSAGSTGGAPGLGSPQRDPCTDRVCVIRREEAGDPR